FLALNMSDEAAARGIHIDAIGLSRALGIPVIETVATRKQGMALLAPALAQAGVPRLRAGYGPVLERAIAQAERLLPRGCGLAPRALGTLLVAGDPTLLASLHGSVSPEALDRLAAQARELEQRYRYSRPFVISRRRLAAIEPLVRLAERMPRPARRRGALSTWTTHPLLGIPLLALVLFAAYQFVGVFGAQVAVAFLEGSVFRDRLVPLLTSILPWPAVREVLVGQSGLVSMGLAYGLAIVLPIVTTFFVAF